MFNKLKNALGVPAPERTSPPKRSGMPNAKVILAKCPQSGGTYGIRIEERGGDWVRTWAFKVDPQKAKHEGFDAAAIDGTLEVDPGYPGCPYCRESRFFVCGCGKLNCWHGENPARCAWCNSTMELQSASRFNVKGESF